MKAIDALNDLTQDERRKRRRQRRIRSQVTAYAILLFAMAGLGTGVFFLIRNAMRYMESYRQTIEAAIESEPAPVEETVQETETPAVESPVETVVEEPAVPTEDELLDEIVNTCISEMPLEDKIAGLFMLTPEQLTGVDTAVKAGSGTQEALSSFAVGGLVYSFKNVKSSEQITEMLQMTASMSKYPILLAVSENGSDAPVARGLGLDTPELPRTIGETGDATTAYSAQSSVAEYLLGYGFNLNLGLNASLSDDDSSYGQDIELTSRMISEAVQGSQNVGLSVSLQSFPVAAGSSDGIDAIELTTDELSDVKSVFRSGIEAGARFVQISNASFPAISGDNIPASLSGAVIRDMLRGELGFDGVIITGALNDPAVKEYYTSEQAAKLALAAGADILYQPEDYKEACEGLINAVNDGTIPEERIDESLRRIFRVKYRDRVAQ